MTPTTTTQRVNIQVFPGFEVDLGELVKPVSDEEFLDFCRRNPEARIERESDGEIVIMAPASTETGGMNFELSGLLWVWTKRDGTGKSFDSSTGFTLPNGALRSPDASWVTFDRWNALSDEDRLGFAHICPDFVIELRSESDSVSRLRSKMEEYIENGASLGWLIDPIGRKVYICRPNAAVEILDDPKTISGEQILNGFALDLKEIWG